MFDIQQADILSLDAIGELAFMHVTDSKLIGVHKAQFVAYLMDIDPSAIFKQSLDLTLRVLIESIEDRSEIKFKNTAP